MAFPLGIEQREMNHFPPMRIRSSYFAFFEFFPCILTSWVYTDMLCILSLLHDRNTVQSAQYEAHISRSCLKCLDIRTQVKYLNAWVITLNTAAYHLSSYKQQQQKNSAKQIRPTLNPRRLHQTPWWSALVIISSTSRTGHPRTTQAQFTRSGGRHLRGQFLVKGLTSHPIWTSSS